MKTQRFSEMPLNILNCIDNWALHLARTMPVPMNKESDAQKQAQAQQNAFNQQLMDTFKTQFGEQQAILSVLTPQLEEMAKNPQGFGATEYAALQAKIVNDTGAQYSNVAKEQAREFATTNEAGLTSGVQAGVQAELAGAAAGQVAGESSSLAIANEQLKQQQKDFALSSLSGIQGGLSSSAANFSGQAGTGLQNQFQNATTVYNQGSLWKNILSGVAGAGLDVLTGGMSGAMNSVLNQGQSFGSGFAAGAFG